MGYCACLGTRVLGLKVAGKWLWGFYLVVQCME